MGYANMPTAIGWAYGSFLGGQIYDRMGDKANLALRYLAEHQPASRRRGAHGRHGEAAETCWAWTRTQATRLLWQTLPALEALDPVRARSASASAVAIFFYARWVRKYEAPDV